MSKWMRWINEDRRRQLAAGLIGCMIFWCNTSGCTISEQGISFHVGGWRKPHHKIVQPDKPTHEFRALFLEDSKNISSLSSTQLSMLRGKNTRDFLKANCVKDSSGNPEFR